MGRVDLSRAKAKGVVQVETRRQLDEVAHRLLDACIEEVPVRTGRLLASHRIETPAPDKRIISANAPYARAVHDGKQGRAPNPWMERAIDRTRIG